MTRKEGARLQGFVWCQHCGAPHDLVARSCPRTGKPLQMGKLLAKKGLEQGAVIANRYSIRSWVSEESVAMVYEAKHVVLGRRVVLKLLRKEETDPRAYRSEAAMMEREASAAARLYHPNVLQVIDFDRTPDGQVYLVRERVVGTTLANTRRAAGIIGLEDAGELLAQILSALATMHEGGLVHRDLGTQNILLVRRFGCRPHVKIAGLGHTSGPHLKPTHALPPSAHYTAPEVIRGEPADARSDIFSCGVILYEMLTGRRPFEAGTPNLVHDAILATEPPRPKQLRPGLPDEWARVIERALEKDPQSRFPSAEAFLEALPSHVRPAARLRAIPDDISASDTLVAQEVARGSAPPSEQVASSAGSQSDRYVGRLLAGKYTMESLLGSGTAGAVYRAKHIGLERPVAVKILHSWNRESEEFIARFKSEALVASGLDHMNVTRVLDFGEDRDGTLYLVMEFIEGGSLEALLAAEGALEEGRAIRIAIQICNALALAHGSGVIHRDIKPENVMIRSAGPHGTDRVKVCDFGLAKQQNGGRRDLTRAGLIFGSPAYMAPEQVGGAPCTEQTDIYATGVTLYEMLTAKLPHDATNLGALFEMKLREPPARASMHVKLDPLLDDIVLRAIATDPSQRHGSVADLRTELAEALAAIEGSPSGTHVTIWPERGA